MTRQLLISFLRKRESSSDVTPTCFGLGTSRNTKTKLRRLSFGLATVILVLSCLWGCSKQDDSFKKSRQRFQSGLEKFKQLNMSEAVLDFRYAIYLDPGFDEAHYYLARAYQKIGSLDEAARYFKLYLKFNPEHTDTHLQLARIYHRKGQDIETLEEGKYLLDRLPPDEAAVVEVHEILGDVYLKVKRDYEAAAYHYRQVMEADPQRPGVYLAFAQIYLVQEDQESAIRMLKRVISLEPNNKEARNYLIIIYRKIGKLDELVKLYQERLEQTPAKELRLIADIHSELAQIYWGQGKTEAAREEALKALEADSTDSRAREILAKGYLRAKQYEQALQELEILYKYEYKLEETLIALAMTYRRLKRITKALDTYENLVFVRPDNFEAQYYLILLCLQTKRWDRAIRGANDILTRFYDFSPAYLFLGRAYMFKGDWGRVIENTALFFMPETKWEGKRERHFYELAYPHLLPPKEFLERDQQKRAIEGRYLSGLAFLGKQRLPEALREFDQVSQRLSTLGDVYLNKAIIYHLQGNLEQALLNCQLASQQVQVNKELLDFIQANIYTSQGDLSQASRHLKRAEGLIYGFELERMDITKNVSLKTPLSLAHLSLGVVYLLNSWKEKAKPEFEKVLIGNPDNPLAKYLNNELYQLMSKHYYKSAHLAKVINQIYQE